MYVYVHFNLEEQQYGQAKASMQSIPKPGIEHRTSALHMVSRWCPMILMSSKLRNSALILLGRTTVTVFLLLSVKVDKLPSQMPWTLRSGSC